MPRRSRFLLLFSLLAPWLLVGLGFLGCSNLSQSPPADTASAGAEESITNNQESGVDEGGIVKAWGEFLIVLRRGRLFSVRVGDQDLTPVSRVDAFPPGSDAGSWYDEMLVHDQRIAVIGYSYRVGATEIGLFDLDVMGRISHRATYFLRSNDYYSSRNYASRLVGGKLIFYMPHYLGQHRLENGRLIASAPPPAFSRYGDEDDWQNVVADSRIYVPEDHRDGDAGTLHTVVTCDMNQTFRCQAHGILGKAGRTFYVSPDSVYVWVHDGGFSDQSGERGAEVYRLPLDGSPAGSLRARGVPVDQFSFKEDEDGYLNVVVRSSGGGDFMWQPERSDGAVALMRVHRSSFALTGPAEVLRSAYTMLPTPSSNGAFQNRFVGDYLLYGTGTSWGSAEAGTTSVVYAHPYRRQGATTEIALPHGVDRIEAMGGDAVVIGTDGESLHFSSLSLEDGVQPIGEYVRRGASQGELRSHGFFYKSEDEHGGVLGLPIRLSGPGYSHLYQGSAEVLFLDVEDLRFRGLGSLRAHEDQIDDDCVASCVDWYGNARPIFYRGRTFALLGYEVVEGIVRKGRMLEVARAHLIGGQRPS